MSNGFISNWKNDDEEDDNFNSVTVNIGNDKKDLTTKTRLTKEEEKQIIKESLAGKVSGKLSLNQSFRLIDAYKETINTIEFTDELSDMSFDKDNNVIFDLGTTNPHEHRRLYAKKSVVFKPNEINCLIGCNGCGKSTIIDCIKDIIKANGYPMVSFNNMEDGGTNYLSDPTDIDTISTMFSIRELSEGEQILNASSKFINVVVQIIDGSIKRDDKFRLFRDNNKIFFLLDAIDSGYSIDNIANLVFQLRQLIDLSKAKDKEIYIIAAVNSYELTRGNRCWDVQKSKEIIFNDYEEYRSRIIETRNHILKQWEKEEEKNKND
ncbi:MAG: hypothetical protein IKR19_08250 [Acholeplasmatales bacterium]|nr:hypothetical protein [Acholeplasmatales bacterium]